MLTDPNTASLATDAAPFAGIAIREKTASDGIVEISADIDGVWDMVTTAASVVVGTAVRLSGSNTVVTALAADLLNGSFCGYAEEGATSSERIRVRLRGF
jgi:hypothetical protein